MIGKQVRAKPSINAIGAKVRANTNIGAINGKVCANTSIGAVVLETAMGSEVATAIDGGVIVKFNVGCGNIIEIYSVVILQLEKTTRGLLSARLTIHMHCWPTAHRT